MRKLKSLFSSSIAMVIMMVLCISNICCSADYYDFYYYEDIDKIQVDTGSFKYSIDKDTLTVTITDIKEGTKTFTIPETVIFDKVYPVERLSIGESEDGEMYSDFVGTLKTINVGKNTKSINFYNCELTALKTINVPAGSKLQYLSLDSCQKLRSINLPSNSVLSEISISNCPKMTEISLPKTIKYLGFLDAPNLKVKIAKGNKHFKIKGNQILSRNGKKLIGIVGNKRNVKIYKSVKVLGDSSINNKYLRKLIIGKNVTKFELDSFASCPKIKIEIKNKNKAPEIKNSAFRFAKKGIKFYVPNQKVANDLRSKLKGSKIKKAKILIDKKTVYEINKG